MNIIYRNFFSLLRAGAFSTSELVEPMSAWKWRQLMALAKLQGVSSLVWDGIRACDNQFFVKFSDDILAAWQAEVNESEEQYAANSSLVASLLNQLGTMQLRPLLIGAWAASALYDVPAHHQASAVCIFFPFATQGKKADEWAHSHGMEVESPRHHVLQYLWNSLKVEHRHHMLMLSSALTNMTLQNIVEQERLEGGTTHVVIAGQRIETPAPTLMMLSMLVSVFQTMFTDTLRIWQLVDIGIMLRKQGHMVDFVKLQGWIERLHLVRMTRLVGTMLTTLFGFSYDELPFISPTKNTDDADTMADFFLKGNSRTKSQLFRYCPGESISSLFVSLSHSLERVEE